jgi:hypothetical protein
MEDRVSKQILSGFADSRLNASHLAWLVKLHTTPEIDRKMKEFFYFYTVFRNQDIDQNDIEWMGEKLMNDLRNPDYDGLSNPPPPGTRIMFAD